MVTFSIGGEETGSDVPDGPLAENAPQLGGYEQAVFERLEEVAATETVTVFHGWYPRDEIGNV